MCELTGEAEYDQAVQKKRLLVVQFGTETCMPCHAIRNRLKAWAERNRGAEYLYVPLERFPALAARESVFAVPTVLVYAEGRMTLRESGYFSVDELLYGAERCLSLMGP